LKYHNEAEAASQAAAIFIAAEAREAIAARGRFISGSKRRPYILAHASGFGPGRRALGSTDVNDADVALTGLFQGRRRMTLTYPIINRARQVLWLVTGKDKAEILGRLRDGDTSIPSGRIENEHALMIADRLAADMSTKKE
jgi:hypothetical protein